MKLFGDSGNRLHTKKPKQEKTKPTETTEKTAGAAKQLDLKELLRAPVWKKLRIPAIVLGCIVVFALLVLLIYSIWEKPPEQKQSEGPSVQATVQPAVTTPAPVQETEKQTIIPSETFPADTPEETPEPTEAPLTSGRKDNCYTFVVLAYDQARANTDTIIVGRLDTEAKTLDLVNIPRDTLVNVSWGVKKASSILPMEKNDMDRFLSHLGDLVGFTADCYAVVNIKAVQKLVDCIGGVYYNVPRDMHYDDPSQNLYIHINKGYQLLDGENAVKVLRFRLGNDNSGYLNGDLGRIATLQDFLMTMATQFLTLGNIPHLSDAIQIFQDNVMTDLSANNIAFFVREFLTLEPESIRFHTMPGELISIRGGSYLQVVIDEWVGIVDDYLNPFYQAITADNLDILQKYESYGAISTTGEVLPLNSFLDFSQYNQ